MRPPLVLTFAILAAAFLHATAAEPPKATAVEQAVLDAPASASAWLAVAKYHEKQDQQSPAILAYARYLTLANGEGEAKAAASRLWSLVVPSNGKDPSAISMRPPSADQDKWWGTDMILNTLRSHRHSGNAAEMTDAEFFATMLEGLTLFTRSMLEDGPLSVMWRQAGIPYFVEAYDKGHLQSLAFDVTRLHDAPDTKAWLKENGDAVQSFRAWSKGWKPGATPAP